MEATAALDEAEQAARAAREEAERLAKEEEELAAAEQELEKEEKAASPRPRTLPEGQKNDVRISNVKETAVVLSGASLQAQVAEAVQVALRNILVRECVVLRVHKLTLPCSRIPRPSLL